MIRIVASIAEQRPGSCWPLDAVEGEGPCNNTRKNECLRLVRSQATYHGTDDIIFLQISMKIQQINDRMRSMENGFLIRTFGSNANGAYERTVVMSRSIINTRNYLIEHVYPNRQ